MDYVKRIRLFAITSLISTMAVSVFAADNAGKAGVNWSGGYIEAVGEGAAKSSGNKSKDKMSATRAAEVKAQRALLETIKGVHVTSTTTVQDSMMTEDIIKTKIDGIVKGAQLIDKKLEVESDGSISATVTMRICLMGGPACKGSVVEALELEATAELPFVPKKSILQEEPEQPAAEPPVKPITESPKKAIVLPRSTYSCDLTKPVTGIVFSLDGRSYERVLMPVVISEPINDESVKVYSAMLVKPAVFRTFGAIRYADSIDNAVKQLHVCGNVLIVPVKEVTKENMMVINARDLATIKETLAHGNNYIEDAKVVISAQ